MKKKLPLRIFATCRSLRYFCAMWCCFSSTVLAQTTALDTLFAEEPEPFAAFGFSIAAAPIVGGSVRLLVAAPFEDPEGAAYVLVYDPVTGVTMQEAAFRPPGLAPEYGHAVALYIGADGERVAVVSDVIAEVTSLSDGRVFVYRSEGEEWVEEAVLRGIQKPSKGLPAFGSGVSGTLLESGEELLFIGAANGGDDPTGASREGSAYAFARPPGTPPGPDAWTMEARLLAGDGIEGDRFGATVALLPTPGLPGGHPGDALVLVGADLHPRTDGHDGAVYTFVRDGATGTWAFAEKITSADLQNFDYFGSAVALLPLPDGQPGEALALIGAAGDATGAPRSGSAYAFRREVDAASPSGFRWVEEAKMVPERPGLGLAFGAAAALTADTLASGTPIALGLVGADPSGESGSHPSEVGLYARTVDGTGAATWTRRATYATGADGTATVTIIAGNAGNSCVFKLHCCHRFGHTSWFIAIKWLRFTGINLTEITATCALIATN